MKQHTNEAITGEIQRIYHVLDKHISDLEIEVLQNHPRHVEVKVSSMYEHPPMNSDVVLPLCEFFETSTSTTRTASLKAAAKHVTGAAATVSRWWSTHEITA